ncbi:hypothetical protein [Effusibacillus lacus]|nr:hypothetical protein [Effusibacillus lacus]TCS70809.1 hypothetical protein EDD64_13040 [Effusibacillus lacus]
MQTEIREKAIQTRIRAEVAFQFAKRCEQEGFTQKEVLNRMIILFNRRGSALFSSITMPQLAASVESEDEEEQEQEFAAAEGVAENGEETGGAGTVANGEPLVINPFGQEVKVRRIPT